VEIGVGVSARDGGEACFGVGLRGCRCRSLCSSECPNYNVNVGVLYGFLCSHSLTE
jgi:hypothetical protein